MKPRTEVPQRFSTWFVQANEHSTFPFVWTADPRKLDPELVVAKVMVERVYQPQSLSTQQEPALRSQLAVMEIARTELPLAVVQQRHSHQLKEAVKRYLRGFNPDAIIEANFDLLPYAVMLIKMAQGMINGTPEPDQPSKIVHLTLQR